MAGPDSDEHYIIGLCDDVLGETGLRGHRFEFLRGDPGKRAGVRLPVDAFYASRNLVIEYYEPQHSKAVPHFDKPNKITVSGVSRGKQRQIYDQRRLTVLPQHGVTVIVLRYDQFAVNSQGRLKRSIADDLAVIRCELSGYIPRQLAGSR